MIKMMKSHILIHSSGYLTNAVRITHAFKSMK